MVLLPVLSALALTTGKWARSAGPKAANKYYGYPYPNAPDCNETTGANCVTDKWLFYQGQCTSWVAYELNHLNGIAFNNSYKQPSGKRWGDATQWKAAAQRAGITVNATPGLGSVAWYSSGHVAYVEQVISSKSVVISEMNYDFHNGFWVHTISTSSGWPTGFIHIKDRHVGKADIAVYRPSNGSWHIDFNHDGKSDAIYTYGAPSTDVPAAADYNGDGKADIAVYRPSNGSWHIDFNHDGTTDAIYTYGAPSTDVPAAADYNGG